MRLMDYEARQPGGYRLTRLRGAGDGAGGTSPRVRRRFSNETGSEHDADGKLLRTSGR